MEICSEKSPQSHGSLPELVHLWHIIFPHESYHWKDTEEDARRTRGWHRSGLPNCLPVADALLGGTFSSKESSGLWTYPRAIR